MRPAASFALPADSLEAMGTEADLLPVRIAAFACTLLLGLALLGCAEQSRPTAGKPLGFAVQRLLTLADGSVVVGGIEISEGGERCAIAKHEAHDFVLRTLTTSGAPAGSRTLSGRRLEGCAETIDSLLPSSGRVLLSGWTLHPSDGGWEDNSSRGPLVARFDADGLDREFGDGGVVPTGQPSGKVALADGSIVTASGRRYDEDGEIDEDFDAPVADAVFAGGIAALPGGRFAVASLVRAHMRAFVLQVFSPEGREVARSQTTFAPDRRFGTADVLDVQARGWTVYVLGRYSPDPGGAGYAHFLYRFDLAGGRGTSLGRVLLNPPGRAVAVDGIALQPNGGVVAVGVVRDGPWRLFVTRYTADGELDETFGHAGRRFLSLGSATSGVLGDTRSAVAVRPDGTIVAAAATLARSTFVYALRPDGRLDRSFGRGGKVTLD